MFAAHEGETVCHRTGRGQKARARSFGKKALLAVAVLGALLLVVLASAPATVAALTPRGTISIYGNDQFTPANGVTGGSGTAGNPYIIENWAISASGADGIYIANTTAYFVIRNCLVENGGGAHFGIRLSNVRNGRIEGNTCRYDNRGIHLGDSCYNTLIGNNCSYNCFYGIYMWKSSNNKLTGNTCKYNTGYGWSHGIRLDDSSYNTLTGNTCSNNGSCGISLESSPNNNLTSNTCGSNAVSGIDLNHSPNSILTGNTCGGNKYGIYLWYSSNNALSGNTCGGNSYGIYLLSSSYNTLTNDNCSNNGDYGIYMWASSNNALTGNTCESNAGHDWSYGIRLDYSSNNALTGNTCSNNSNGICLHNSSNDNLTGNTCGGNAGYGIYMYSSSNNNLTYNTCNNNTTYNWSYSIRLDSSSYNKLTGNTCSNNRNGICLYSSSNNNTLTYNRLLNNPTCNAYDSGANAWGKDGKGNWWSDWQPPAHPDSNGDGIVDSARSISGGGADPHPLVMPGFSVSVSPMGGYVRPGSGTTATVTVTNINCNLTVSLTASGQPSGVSVSFSPSSGTPTFTSTMTIGVGTGAPAGTYMITITGTSGWRTYSCIYTLTVGNRYAVLIAASDAGHDEFWNDLKIMHDTLVEAGYVDDGATGFNPATDHIAMLYGDGNDEKTGKYGTPAGTTITDFSATMANVQSVFASLGSVMTDDDFLYVYTFDHGGFVDANGNGHCDNGEHATLCVQDGNIRDDDFAGPYLGQIAHYWRRAIVMQQCHSGGFIDDLSNDRTVIATAAMSVELAGTCDQLDANGNWSEGEWDVEGVRLYYHGEFSFHIMSALRGVDPRGNPVNADADGNGRVSMLEAFNYAWSNDSRRTLHPDLTPGWVDWDYTAVEHPQYDDSGDGVSHQAHVWAASPPPNAETQGGLLPAGGDGGLGGITYL